MSPSGENSLSGSGLTFANGSTAIDGSGVAGLWVRHVRPSRRLEIRQQVASGPLPEHTILRETAVHYS